MSGFLEIARNAFAFLQNDYEFSLDVSSRNDGGGILVYSNIYKGVGIKIEYDYNSAFVFIFIHRLVDGVFIDNQLPVNEKSEINCFDFNDILDENDKMKPSYEYPENGKYADENDGLKYFVLDFSKRLREKGKDILMGDFSRLPKAEAVIKSRARRFHLDQS